MSRRTATAAFSGLLMALGLTLLVETAVVGGQAGYALGGALVLAGAARLYLSLRG